MAWKLFGHETTPAQLPAELRSILAQMQRERVAFEALTTGARDSSQQLAQLTQPIAEAQKVVAELQGRVKALERLVPVLATLDEQTEGVSRTQRRTETQVEHTAAEVKNLRTEIGAAASHVRRGPRTEGRSHEPARVGRWTQVAARRRRHPHRPGA